MECRPGRGTGRCRRHDDPAAARARGAVDQSRLTINELAVLTVTEQSTMSRTLDGLEALGLVRRTPRENDLRMREITVTEAGRARFGEVWPIMFRCFGEAFAGLSSAEYQALVATLHKIMANTATSSRTVLSAPSSSLPASSLRAAAMSRFIQSAPSARADSSGTASTDAARISMRRAHGCRNSP